MNDAVDKVALEKTWFFKRRIPTKRFCIPDVWKYPQFELNIQRVVDFNITQVKIEMIFFRFVSKLNNRLNHDTTWNGIYYRNLESFFDYYEMIILVTSNKARKASSYYYCFLLWRHFMWNPLAQTFNIFGHRSRVGSIPNAIFQHNALLKNTDFTFIIMKTLTTQFDPIIFQSFSNNLTAFLFTSWDCMFFIWI